MRKWFAKYLDFKIDTYFYFGMSIATAFINYFYQIYLGNRLSVSNYGIFNTLYSFCVNFSSFFSPIAVFFCCVVAENDGHLSRIHKITKGVSRFGIIVSILVSGFIICMILLGKSGGFRMRSSEAIVLIIFAIISSGFCNISISGVQGTSKLIVFGILSFLTVALKFIISVIGIKIANLPEVPIIAFFMSNSMCGLIAIGVLIRFRKKEIEDNYDDKDFELSRLLGFYGKTFVINILYSFYVNGGELLLLSQKYDSEEVGTYSLIITIAKSSIYLCSMFATIMLPRFAHNKSNKRENLSKYYGIMALSFVMGGSWIVFLRVLGIRIIPVLFGKGYADVLPYVSYVSVWVIFLGMLCMTNAYHMGTDNLNGYFIVLAIVSLTMYSIFQHGNISFWHSPIMFGTGAAVIVSWSLLDTAIRRKE